MQQIVVVTGASRGIGLALTERHAARGDRVMATCRRPESAVSLAALAAKWPAHIDVVRLDVTDGASIDSAAAAAEERFGRVDLLWSNAGVYPGSPGIDVGEGPLDSLAAGDGLAVLATNAVGPILVARAFMSLLRRGNSPRLIALSSGYGSVSTNAGTPYWYGASKAALNMLHRSLAADPAAHGVIVLLVSPGWTQTDMGGPRAPTPLDDAVRGLMNVADTLTQAHNGAFLDYRGETVPW